jgi:hypothetical protein
MSFANDVVFIACNGVRKKTTYNKDPEPVSLLRPDSTGSRNKTARNDRFQNEYWDNKETEQEGGR